MRLQDLQNNLRSHIRARLDHGELTGIELSQAAGFQQAHLSNFLKGRRGLSLDSMDRLLQTLDLGVLDLVDPAELESRGAAGFAPGENVAVVSVADAARLPVFSPQHVRDNLRFPRAYLRRLKAGDLAERGAWLRFVLIQLDARAAGVLLSRAVAGVTLLVDRHYNSLRPYRRIQPNLYCTYARGRCSVGYVAIAGDQLIVRPRSRECPLEAIRIERGRRYSDYIVGRVCHAVVEV
jgi:hypothetical protein